MRRSGATMASRSPARAAIAASMPPAVSCRKGLPSPGGSMGHMLALYSGREMWKMETDEMPGRAAYAAPLRRRAARAHRVGHHPGAPARVRRVPEGGRPAARGGGYASPGHRPPRDRHDRGGDGGDPGGGGRGAGTPLFGGGSPPPPLGPPPPPPRPPAGPPPP